MKKGSYPYGFSIVEDQIIDSQKQITQGNKVGYLCNICGYFGFRNEMRNDWDLGWIHWGCWVNSEKDRKSDERIEWELEQISREEI